MLKQPKHQSYKSVLVISLVVGVMFFSLACSFGSSDSQAIRIRKILPKLTPTSVAMQSAEEVPIQAAEPASEVSVQEAPLANQAPVNAPPAVPQQAPDAAAPVQQVNPAPAQAQQPTEPEAAVPDPDALPPQPAPDEVPDPIIAPTLPANPSSPTYLVPPVQNRPEPPAVNNPEDSTPTRSPETPGWAFVSIQTSMYDDQAYVVGELVNNTGVPQQNVEVSGVFYDAQGTVIQDEIDTLSYVPIEVIPAGAHVPFELSVESGQPIYRLDLLAMSDRTEETPRQDFEIMNVSNWEDADGMYCLGGDIKNSDNSIDDFLVILASAYNSQGRLISFGEYAPGTPEISDGIQTSPFEMCLDPLNQQVAHYELNAMGY